jgi:nucleotide-binding universal stress UspA family protein
MVSPIRSIVAASDFSVSAHRAARRAAALATAHGAALRLLHVVDDAPTAALRGTSSFELHERVCNEARSALDSLADDVVAAGGTVTDRTLREGRVIERLLAAAADSDLLVLGARGVNPVQDFVLGATAERIARKIAAPMLVVKQDPQIPYDQVLVPVDFLEHSGAALRFAATLAPAATLQVFMYSTLRSRVDCAASAFLTRRSRPIARIGCARPRRSWAS